MAARDSSAVDVATGFVRAQAAFDADAVIGYLADDFVGGADLGDFGRTPQEIRQVLALSEAQRSRQMLQPCVEVEDSAEGVVVRCPFDAHGFGSDELGLARTPASPGWSPFATAGSSGLGRSGTTSST